MAALLYIAILSAVMCVVGGIDNAEGFKAELVHRSSPRSPFYIASQSRTERIRNAVTRSRIRATALASRRRPTLSTSKDGDIDGNYSTISHPMQGEYTMDLSIGTPPQTFQVIVDTGSDLVWIESEDCFVCSSGTTTYSSSRSSTYSSDTCGTSLCRAVQNASQTFPECTTGTCDYWYTYGSGASGGVFSNETITLSTTHGGSKTFDNFGFGEGSRNYGFSPFAGLVGLGQGPLSLVSQLGSAIENRFSYCLVDWDSTTESSLLFFGKAASLRGRVGVSVAYTNYGEGTYYVANLQSVTVNYLNARVVSPTIVDSGTTLTYLDSSTYYTILRDMSYQVRLPTVDGSSAGLDLCYDVRRNRNYVFPRLTLSFGNGVTITPPVGNYFIYVDDSRDTMCLALATLAGSEIGINYNILGNIMQQNYHVVYDRNSSTISFEPARCSSL